MDHKKEELANQTHTTIDIIKIRQHPETISWAILEVIIIKAFLNPHNKLASPWEIEI